MNSRSTLIFALISGFFAVGIGAFGAHALKSQLSTDVLGEMMAVFKTASQYHFYHTFALLGLGIWWMERKPNNALPRWASSFFMAGIILFCGSLYLLVILQRPELGMITPVGGVFFLAGWLLWLISLIKS